MHRRIKLGMAALLSLCFGGRLGAVVVNLPDITITSFSHGYTPADASDPFGGIADGVSFRGDAGTYTSSPFVGQVQNGDIVRQHILAPAGYAFTLFADPQLPGEVFGTQITWTTGDSDSVGSSQPVSVTYDNPHGTAPTTIFGSAGAGTGGELINWNFHSPVAGNFSFTGMTDQFTVGNATAPGSHTFNLTSISDPSFYASGVGTAPSDAILLSLTAIPEPGSILLAIPFCLTALRRRRNLLSLLIPR